MRFILIITVCFLLSSPLLATGDKNNPPSLTQSSPHWADFEDDDEETTIPLLWASTPKLTTSEPLPSSSSATSSTTLIHDSPQKAHHPLKISDFIDAEEEAKANFIQDVHALFPLPSYTEHEDIVTILKKKGKNSKVYLTGKVRYIPDEKPVMEQGKERVKVDYTRDF